MVASTHAVGTLGYLKDKVADELARSDLTSQIADKITEAIAFHQNDRFAFNESRDLTFSTIAGQEFYTASDNANIPTLFYFDYVILYLGSIPWPLKRREPIDVEIYNQNGLVRGQPIQYAYYNKQLRLGPVPDTIYSMRIAGQITYAAPATDDEANNPWMTDAEKLIRARAKYELAVNVLKDMELASAMGAQVTEAFDNLKGLANRLTGTGQMRPTQF